MYLKSILTAFIFICFMNSIFAQQWSNNGNDIYNINSGNVGIGTLTPDLKLTVNGNGM